MYTIDGTSHKGNRIQSNGTEGVRFTRGMVQEGMPVYIELGQISSLK